MTKPLVIKQGDTADAPRVDLTGQDKQPANLTGATVVLHLRGHTEAIGCTIVDAATGVVRPDRAGFPTVTQQVALDGEFQVTYSDLSIQTFPSQGYIKVLIYPDLDPA